MENNEIIYCPYCPEGVEMQEGWSSASIVDKSMPYGIRHASYVHYFCPVCKTFSPRAETREEALHFALRRYNQEPEARMLEVEEVNATLDPVWIEHKIDGKIELCIVGDPVIKKAPTFSLTSRTWHGIRYRKDYNKTWRCWLRKPTEEERKAVEWDG